MSLPPVLILGADTPIALAVIRELGGHGVPVHAIGRSAGAIGGASRYCTSFSVRGEGPLAAWLPERVRASGAAALLAISEGDLKALAEIPPEIAGCRILTPRAEPLAIVLDKARTLAAAQALGIAVPQAAGEAPTSWPVVVKWPDPNAAFAMLDAAGLPFHKAEYCQDQAALDAVRARYRDCALQPLFQSYCPGIGLGQMLHMEDGAATLRFQHERVHEWPPEGGVSTLCRAVPLDRHRAQMDHSEALLRAIGWKGPAMVEYRFDPATGRYVLMEVNGRFWGSLPLARANGAHFAWELYRRAMLGDRTAAPAPRSDRRARFMVPETRRLVRILFRPGAIADPTFQLRPVREALGYLAAFLDPRMRYYVFEAGDPRPSFTDLRNMVRRPAPPENPGPTPSPRAQFG